MKISGTLRILLSFLLMVGGMAGLGPAFRTQVCAQVNQDSVIFSLLGEYHYKTDFPFVNYFNFSAFFDREGRDYVFAAGAELGLPILDISNPGSPFLAARLSKADFNNLNVSFLQQRGNLLYVALGSFESLVNVTPGLAIVDVSNPVAPVILDIWSSPGLTEGSATLSLRGDHAFLGVMEDGIVVLDISDSTDIQMVTSFIPDPAYPAYNTLTPAARGMWIRNDTLFLAYDSGGLRLIDISIPQSLSQMGEFADSLMWQGPPPATPVTNHVRLRGRAAFVTNDYCGISSVNFDRGDSMYTLDWYNPWNCEDFPGLPLGQNSTWFGSPGHSNEMAMMDSDHLLMSGGDSEVLALDVSDPGNLRKMGGYVHVGDSEVVWGLDFFNGRVVLAYIRNPWEIPLQPYIGNWGGIKLLDVSLLTAQPEIQSLSPRLLLSPNPVQERLQVTVPEGLHRPWSLLLCDLQGKCIEIGEIRGADIQEGKAEIGLNGLPAGMYFVKLEERGEQVFWGKFVKL